MSEAHEDTLTAVEDPARGPGSDSASRSRSSGSTPLRLGRYVVIEHVGSGAMGAVYSAYDPQLDRKVAIKLLLPGPGPEEARKRLLREAQAMAQLSHPNVVGVHDVGEHGDNVYMAMDFVRGESLRAWLEREPRTWSEVLAMCMQAGRGLAAAHDAGLVHRDFKPDNVLVDDKGRAMVTDFGLARAGATVVRDDPALSTEPSAAEATLEKERHAIVGTPAYMAPEQFEGGVVGARSDQFGFCVALWEALFGTRPFGGASIVELALAVRIGVVREPTRARGVPRWLRRAVTRGLAVDPVERWPSMDALLAELERGQARARKRSIAALVGTLALAVGGIAAWQRSEHTRAVEGCEASGASISAIWPGKADEARTAVGTALLATQASYAASTVEKLQPRLDAWATAWQDARTQTCLQHTVELRWSDDLAARADECLEERRAELAALVEELRHADTTVIQKALNAASSLGRVEPCADEPALARRPSLPADLRAQVMRIRAELSRASTRELTGKPKESLAIAEEALGEADRVQWPPLEVQARLALGAALERAGDYVRAQQVLEDAYVGAATADLPELAERAASYLVAVVGARRARFDEGLLWARLAEVEVASQGGVPDELVEAGRLNALGILYVTKGSYADAKDPLERALAIRERVLGVGHPEVAASLGNLATVQRALGEMAEARALSERALAIREEALGPDHPELALSLGNLANIYGATGDYAEAKALQQRALAIREAALGPDHLDVAQSLANLGAIYRALGDTDQAKALSVRALAIREKQLGPDHLDVAISLTNLANIESSRRDLAAAEALHTRALAIRTRVLGTDHRDVAQTLHNLANVQRMAGRRGEARTNFERALAIYERALGPDHADVARTLVGLGRLALLDGRAAEAVPLVERALPILERASTPAEDLADARFVLARSLWESHGDRERALELAERAATGMTEVRPKDRTEIEAWIAERRAN